MDRPRGVIILGYLGIIEGAFVALSGVMFSVGRAVFSALLGS